MKGSKWGNRPPAANIGSTHVFLQGVNFGCQVIKARKGFGNDKSARKFVDGYSNYHNFVRPHTGVPDNQTPAETAGIDLKLDKQNPLKDLIE